ncbi:hypothetical protein [Planctobacterium marinum]|uniref:Uncharacterized protein n=1 Tax=Planctobacterium marinum TaxID=1631968 RepID=A0AA48KP07_9ALTE|nr:hypothetical protein MACH26_16420 [Planctobacterium marinum]
MTISYQAQYPFVFPKLLPSLLMLIFSFKAVSSDNFGFSGMAYMGNNQYLVVVDTKNHKPGVRLGTLQIKNGQAPKFSPVDVKDWGHPHGAASDLESACKIPDSENQYLVSESGTWKGKFGRIFWLEIVENQASVKNVFQLPILINSDETTQGSNYEGMLCVKNANRLHILMGERGGTAAIPDGYLLQGVLNLATNQLSWLPESEFKYVAKGRTLLSDSMPGRSISDLYLENNIIWASATQDDSDMGPFNSVIYAVGKLTFEQGRLIVSATKQQHWNVAGLKIEALAQAPESFPNARLSYGSEDEDFGGIWRLLSN